MNKVTQLYRNTLSIDKTSIVLIALINSKYKAEAKKAFTNLHRSELDYCSIVLSLCLTVVHVSHCTHIPV